MNEQIKEHNDSGNLDVIVGNLISTGKISGYIRLLDDDIFYYKINENTIMIAYNNMTHILNYTTYKNLKHHLRMIAKDILER